MKTKNVRVRIKDIKQGVTVYISHPVCGIEKRIVASRPYMVGGIGLFFDYTSKYGVSETSIRDSGVQSGESYNHRRTFFKLSQAKEWASKMRTDRGFIIQQARHMEACKRFDMMCDY